MYCLVVAVILITALAILHVILFIVSKLIFGSAAQHVDLRSPRLEVCSHSNCTMNHTNLVTWYLASQFMLGMILCVALTYYAASSLGNGSSAQQKVAYIYLCCCMVPANLFLWWLSIYIEEQQSANQVRWHADVLPRLPEQIFTVQHV